MVSPVRLKQITVVVLAEHIKPASSAAPPEALFTEAPSTEN